MHSSCFATNQNAWIKQETRRNYETVFASSFKVQFLRIQWITWTWRCRYGKGPLRAMLLMNVIRQVRFASATKMSVWINNWEGQCIDPAFDQTMIIYQFIKVKPAICKYIGYGAIYISCAVLVQKKVFGIDQIIHSPLTSHRRINRLTHQVE
jgi:hypothetical protein